MTAQQFNSQGVKRGSNGGNLIQDIDAIAILVDHALNTGDLTGDAIRPAPDTFHGAAIHVIYVYQVYVYGKLLWQWPNSDSLAWLAWAPGDLQRGHTLTRYDTLCRTLKRKTRPA